MKFPIDSTEKIDWLCFSFDSDCVGSLAEEEQMVVFLESSSGVLLTPSSGTRWYRKSYRGEGLTLLCQPRIPSKNRWFQVEMSGGFFVSPEREILGCDWLRMFRGHCSRVDVAWDFWMLAPHEPFLFLKMIDSTESIYGQKRDEHIENGYRYMVNWGYGDGCEVMLKMYDKAHQQKELGSDLLREKDAFGWWRIEIVIRGNTLKDQIFRPMTSLEFRELGRAFYVSRYSSDFMPDCSYSPTPRARGLAGLRGQLEFWHNKEEAAKKKLALLRSSVVKENIGC